MDNGRIEEYKFNENSDFIVFTNLGENPLGGRPTKEYRLSLDMGKELAMVENNEEGRKVRRYFIECEKALRANMVARRQPTLDEDMRAIQVILEAVGIKGNQLALGLSNAYRVRRGLPALESTGIELIAPTQSQLLTPTQIGKQLSPPLSARKANNLLELAGYQTKEESTGLWSPTQQGLDAGVVLVDTGKRHGSGTPVRQLKWPQTIVPCVQVDADQLARPREQSDK